MDLQILLFCLYGGIVSVDTEAAWQVMISQPLVACSMAGYLLGNTEVGILVGILLQLPFLFEIPAGAAKVSHGNLGAYVAAGIAAVLCSAYSEFTHATTAVAIVLGLLLSRFALIFVRGLRNINRLLILKVEQNVDQNPASISIYQVLGVVLTFIFGIFFSAFSFIIGKFMMISLLKSVTVPVQIDFSLIKPILLGASVAVMLRMHVRKESAGYSVLGAAVAVLFFLISG